MKTDLNKKILIYTSISYGVTWFIAFGIYFLHLKAVLSSYQLNLYHSFAAIGPTIGALFTAYFFYGKAGIRKLLSKISSSRLDRKTILFVTSPLLLFVLGIFIYAVIKSDWYNFENFVVSNWTSYRTLIVWLLPLLTYSIFEEIGWRGFLLPHLQQKYNAWTSTILLTIIWALWHIPFFFYRFDFSLGISIGFFFGIFVGSIILTHIYNSSKGFLLPTMTFHFLNNFCSAFDKEVIVAVLSTGFVFIAIYIFRKFGILNLSMTDRQRNYFENEKKTTA